MTAGRKPLPPATLHGPDYVTETPPDMAAAEAQARALMRSGAPAPIEALAKDLAYDGALTVESLEEEIKFYQRRSVEAVLEMGKRLLLLKEVAGHGNFVERIEALGVGYKMANKFMSATLKFSKVSSTRLFELPNLNQGKLLELLVLDDGEIEALNNGEEVRGIVLDDIDCMSVSEVRRAFRKKLADQEAEIAKALATVSGQMAAKDRLIADSKKRIAELVEEKNKREGMTDFEQEQALEARLANATLEAINYLIPIRATVDAIRGLDHAPQGLYVAMQAALHRVITEVASIATDYGIGLDFGLPTLSTADAFNIDALADLDDPNADEDFGPEFQSQ